MYTYLVKQQNKTIPHFNIYSVYSPVEVCVKTKRTNIFDRTLHYKDNLQDDVKLAHSTSYEQHN